MNYYPFHVGDYAAHTAHLEPMEDLAYRRMLDAYYLRESPLPVDVPEVARLVRMRSSVDAVQAVLDEFFVLTDGGWAHDRCDRELASFRRMSEGGKAGAAKRWAKGGDSPPIAPLSPPYNPPHQPPIGNQNQNQNQNQEPTDTKPRKPRRQPDGCLSVDDLVAEGVDPQVAKDWMRARKDKGAKTLTKTAWEGVKAEAIKAGLRPGDAVRESAKCGWQGFKASWLHQAARASPSRPPTAAQMAMAQACPTLVAPHLQGYATQHEQTEIEVINADARLLD